MEFHQAVLSTLREEEINAETFAADVQRLTEMADFAEGQEDESGEGERLIQLVALCFGVLRISQLRTSIDAYTAAYDQQIACFYHT